MKENLVKLLQNLEETDSAKINQSYDLEDMVMHAIRMGNPDILIHHYETSWHNVFLIRNAHDTLRDRKNGLVIRKTLFRIAARDAGVPPVYLHLLTNYYAGIIEQAQSVDYLNQYVSEEMFNDFCAAVREYSMSNYTHIVKEAVLYIDEHLMQPLTLRKVADIIHVHPTYLSQRFKKETTKNMTDYINTQRIKLATFFLHSGETNITTVSNQCGYSSSSYFSKVFYKYKGVYPREYIKQITIKG